jgi:hypothetical protein
MNKEKGISQYHCELFEKYISKGNNEKIGIELTV